ncbi:hypothetical protein [Chitinolyticbacter meiyuanensis]|uniref:hypothetical protein n=1 Tax=Chitinolyticbacter meiyuanensis TaxID=682798 RepID=UPI0011E5A494|nr:hypothetical protein [Chitinolyticbacter meiyuanensis]
MKLFVLLAVSSLIAGCGTVSTVAAVGAATVSVAATAVNVTTTAAGVAWDVGKATVSGATTATGWAIDAAKRDAPAAASAQQSQPPTVAQAAEAPRDSDITVEPYRE